MTDSNITSFGLTTNVTDSNSNSDFVITGFNGTTCWWDDYNDSLYNSTTNIFPRVHCLTSGDRMGLLLDVEAGLLSGLAVLFVLALIARSWLRHRRLVSNKPWNLIQEPADIYVLLLFCFELLQALGGITSIEWLRTGIVRTGSYCEAQGIIQQLGEMGVAISTLIIALHTFRLLWWGRTPYDQQIAYGFVCAIALYDILFVSISAGIHRDSYIEPDPFWCWLGGHYLGEKIAGEYVWMWLALAASLFLYPMLYFLARGNITTTGLFSFRVHKRAKDDGTREANRSSLNGMLWYPGIYAITVLPLSVARWYTFSSLQGNRAYLQYQATSALTGGTFFAETMFRLSGVFNVIIILTTRRQLLFLREARDPRAPSSESLAQTNGHQPLPSNQSASMEMREQPSADRRGSNTGGLAMLDQPGWDPEQPDDSDEQGR